MKKLIGKALNRWRINPVINLINYGTNTGCFTRWFYVERAWGGKLVFIGVKHWAIEFDFRRDWIADMCNPTR